MISFLKEYLSSLTQMSGRELAGTVLGILLIIVSAIIYISSRRNRILLLKLANDVLYGANNFCFANYTAGVDGVLVGRIIFVTAGTCIYQAVIDAVANRCGGLLVIRNVNLPRDAGSSAAGAGTYAFETDFTVVDAAPDVYRTADTSYNAARKRRKLSDCGDRSVVYAVNNGHGRMRNADNTADISAAYALKGNAGEIVTACHIALCLADDAADVPVSSRCAALGSTAVSLDFSPVDAVLQSS